MNISKKSINSKLKIIKGKNIHKKNTKLWLRQKEIQDNYVSMIMIESNNNPKTLSFKGKVKSILAKHYNTNTKYINKLLTFTIV
jgi:hypothetical protein